jgi:PAS domain S-box-containing protein
MREAEAFVAEPAVRSIRRELTWVSASALLLVAALLGVTWLGLDMLASVRGYVAGAGMYNRAGKDALFQLARYAETGDEAFFERYERSIGVLRAAGEARAALTGPDPDLEAARDAMLRIRNQPDVAAGMIRLFRLSAVLPGMERSLEVWQLHDEAAAEIAAIASELRAATLAGAPAEQRRAFVTRLDAVDARLDASAGRFVDYFAEASRGVRRVVFAAAASAGALLIAIAATTGAHWLRRQRRTETLFRSLAEDAQDVLSLVDRVGVMHWMSPAVERELGWPQSELMSRSVYDFVHPDDAVGVSGAISRCFERPGEAVSVEFRFRHPSGSWRTFEASARVLSTGADEPLIVSVSRDVTVRRELEARLREAHKMESLGRLAGGVAHDFGNLLTAMLGSVELLKGQLAEGSPQREELDRIAHAGERAARLTSQLLAFARRQPVELRVVDLAALVREMEPLLRRLLPGGIELALELGRGPTTVRGAPDQLEQVLVNLVVNARDAIGGAGRIRLGARRQGERVYLDVRDTGAGMSAEVQRRAFEPFFTTKPPGQGTGLGLATCYGIVEQCGGTIAAVSTPGSGTTIRIELPFVPAEAGAAAPAPHPVRAPRGLTVLLAEDDDAVRRIASAALQRAGHRVIEAPDGAAALRAAEVVGERIDVLVTDVVMPGSSGPALAAALRARRPALPVLFVSGYAEDDALSGDVSQFPAAFLAKPFTADALRAKVEALAGGGEAAGPAPPYAAAARAEPAAERPSEPDACPTPAPSPPTTPPSRPRS